MTGDTRPVLRAHDIGCIPTANSRVVVLMGEITPAQIEKIIRLFSPPEQKPMQ